MESRIDPGPVDKSVLYDQENHISSAIWDGQKWERKIPAVDQGVDLSTDVELGGKGKMRSEIKEWLERRVHILEGNDGVDENTYMDWYERITRKYVGRPESLESEFQRIAASMRDIASIADTLSRDQMNPQDGELLDEIKKTVHVCLTDVVGNSKNGRAKNAVKRKREGG
ncbi:hypothetical protein C1H46_006575 [Malus baccata]|uniref:Uncharacterized protein n=1 Tax=Malus baccata TaxID=106549 RepID=A0A540N9T8_MALBA|nr:hypothetical protein C1H46_006575 [Malus baccata]